METLSLNNRPMAEEVSKWKKLGTNVLVTGKILHKGSICASKIDVILKMNEKNFVVSFLIL